MATKQPKPVTMAGLERRARLAFRIYLAMARTGTAAEYDRARLDWEAAHNSVARFAAELAEAARTPSYGQWNVKP